MPPTSEGLGLGCAERDVEGCTLKCSMYRKTFGLATCLDDHIAGKHIEKHVTAISVIGSSCSLCGNLSAGLSAFKSHVSVNLIEIVGDEIRTFKFLYFPYVLIADWQNFMYVKVVMKTYFRVINV